MLNRMVKHVLDPVFHGLANPVRREMLHRLATGELSVGDLAAPFEISAPAVSRHLRILEEAGLVSRRRRGREHLVSLVPPVLGEAASWVEGVRDHWERSFDALDAHLRGDGP
jgi:DNA-binding transcriptional ArsR family regulator